MPLKKSSKPFAASGDPVVEQVYHGALNYAELEALGIDPAAVLDFSVNSNPYGPPAGVLEAVSRTPLDRYPDRDSITLRRALAVGLGIDSEQIVTGNGSTELLLAAGRVLLKPGERVLVIGPTFGEYARSAKLGRALVSQWDAAPQTGFNVDLDTITRQIQDIHPRLVFLCNPNNPTGFLLSLETISFWVSAFPDTLFMVDEAYGAFAAGFQSALTLKAENVLVFRSMTKDYALAGLRLGYAAGPLALVEVMRQNLPAWNVNALAQAAGLAALADPTFPLTFQNLASAKADLLAGLDKLGLSLCPSQTHYFLVEVGRGAVFRRRLLQKNVLVRDCASFGLPNYVRIATRKPPENEILLEAIKKIL